MLENSVVDPDPDPYVFGPPGSGSGPSSKNSKKNLHLLFYDFLSLNNDANVVSKLFCVAALKVTDENSRFLLRIRIR
jgi:hypothetical protein